MTSTHRTITLSLSILALLALPSLASAASVGGQLTKASSALDNAVTAAEDHGDLAAFESYAQAAHNHTAKAERAARKTDGKARKAKAMRRVATQYDENLNEYAALIELVPADVQPAVVVSVELSAEARQRVVEFLTRIAERLPEPARATVLGAIATFETDGDIESLVEALMSPEVVGSVKTMILDQISAISAHIGEIFGQFEGLSAILPPGAAEMIDEAIARIQAHIGEISALIDELLAGFGGDGGWFGGFGLGSLCDVFAGLPFPMPICD